MEVSEATEAQTRAENEENEQPRTLQTTGASASGEDYIKDALSVGPTAEVGSMLRKDSIQWFQKTDLFRYLKAGRNDFEKSLDFLQHLKHQTTGREQWGSNGIFLLTCVSVIFSSANAIPVTDYITSRAGGYAALFFFLIILAFAALFIVPILIMEFSLGQITQGSPAKVMDSINPNARGVGIAAALLAVLLSMLEVSICATFIWYMVNSFKAPFPYEILPDDVAACERANNYTGAEQSQICNAGVCFFNTGKELCIPSAFKQGISFLQDLWVVDSATNLSWKVALLALGIYSLTAILLVKGIRYVSVIVPLVSCYPILIILVLIAAYNSSDAGQYATDLLFSGTYSDWSQLWKIGFPQLAEINAHILHSSGAFMGLFMLTTLASFNQPEENVHRNSWIIFAFNWGFILIKFVFTFAQTALLVKNLGLEDAVTGFSVGSFARSFIMDAQLQNPNAPGWNVFYIREISILPALLPSNFSAVPGEHLWVTVYYMWEIFSSIVFIWASLLPLDLIISECKMFTEDLLGTSEPTPKTEAEARGDASVDGFMQLDNMSHPSIRITGQRISSKWIPSDASSLADFSNALEHTPDRTTAQSERFSRRKVLVGLLICLVSYLISLLHYASQPGVPNDHSIVITEIFTDVAKLFLFLQVLIVAWVTGIKDQMRFSGTAPVIFLFLAWHLVPVIHQIYRPSTTTFQVYDFFLLPGALFAVSWIAFAITSSLEVHAESGAEPRIYFLSIRERIWKLFLGNIEATRAGMNLSMTGDANKHIPMYWSVLIKFYCSPALLTSLIFSVRSHAVSIEQAIMRHPDLLPTSLLVTISAGWLVAFFPLALFLFPSLTEWTISAYRLEILHWWFPKHKKRCSSHFMDELFPLKIPQTVKVLTRHLSKNSEVVSNRQVSFEVKESESSRQG